jgi:hypothetical protein
MSKAKMYSLVTVKANGEVIKTLPAVEPKFSDCGSAQPTRLEMDPGQFYFNSFVEELENKVPGNGGLTTCEKTNSLPRRGLEKFDHRSAQHLHRQCL